MIGIVVGANCWTRANELRSYSLLTHVRLYTSFGHPDGGVCAALLDREPFKTAKTFEKLVTLPLCVVACAITVNMRYKKPPRDWKLVPEETGPGAAFVPHVDGDCACHDAQRNRHWLLECLGRLERLAVEQRSGDAAVGMGE